MILLKSLLLLFLFYSGLLLAQVPQDPVDLESSNNESSVENLEVEDLENTDEESPSLQENIEAEINASEIIPLEDTPIQENADLEGDGLEQGATTDRDIDQQQDVQDVVDDFGQNETEQIEIEEIDPVEDVEAAATDEEALEALNETADNEDDIEDEGDIDEGIDEEEDVSSIEQITEEDNINQELLELTGETEDENTASEVSTEQEASWVEEELNLDNEEAEAIENQPEGILSEAAIQAEEIGFSASFIKLPFEESKQERVARLEQDSYFDELVHISQTGVHQYEVVTSPLRGSMSLNLGVFPAPSINNDGFTYAQQYGTNSRLMLFANYEWNLFKNLGNMSIHLELGGMWASGNGRFTSPENAGRTPKEQYLFLMMPATVGLMYSLEFWKNQFFVPFGIGGGSYFGLLELRDDFDFGSIGVAASPSVFFGGGIQLLLDALASGDLTVIDREFGINHIYLIGEVRYYISLSGDFQFEGLVASGGVRFDF